MHKALVLVHDGHKPADVSKAATVNRLSSPSAGQRKPPRLTRPHPAGGRDCVFFSHTADPHWTCSALRSTTLPRGKSRRIGIRIDFSLRWPNELFPSKRIICSHTSYEFSLLNATLGAMRYEHLLVHPFNSHSRTTVSPFFLLSAFDSWDLATSGS